MDFAAPRASLTRRIAARINVALIGAMVAVPIAVLAEGGDARPQAAPVEAPPRQEPACTEGPARLAIPRATAEQTRPATAACVYPLDGPYTRPAPTPDEGEAAR
ncbi:hypothetical protein [Acuticoccus kandeliae]|uniref:hypothetical protein n=1 Tax=Acuticoccus kandeliae TaxID=2073160 RepID=UPI00196A6DB7|nr:hypothetical protein [Acuticoccus kandeliae]